MIAPAAALAAFVAAATAGAPPSALPMPGGEAGIGFDDLRFSPELGRIVVPAGRTGRIDLVDPRSATVETIDGFTRSDARTPGHGDGTTSADVGEGLVFAIDRTDRTVAAVDPRARRIVARARLGGAPDYVRWVGAANEVWVTEPGRELVETFRLERGPSPTLVGTGTIPVPAGPEALVVDSASGRAYTNTFGDETVVIDVRARTVVARWANGCQGARGIALDPGRALVFVGCEEGKAVALDAAHDGRTVGTARTGDGVDGIAYSPRVGHLYVPAGDAAELSVVAVGERGELRSLGTVPAAPDAHCAAADDRGTVYVCDPRRGRLLVIADPFARPR